MTSDDNCAWGHTFWTSWRDTVLRSIGGWHAYPSVVTQTRWIKWRQTPGREWRKVDVPRRAVQDQFAHCLAGRRRVEHAPHTVASRHVRTVNTRDGADEGKPVFADGPEARLPRFDRRRGEHWRDIPTQRFEPRVRTLINRNIGRIDRQRPGARDRTHPRFAIGSRKKLGGRISPLASRYSRNSASAGMAPRVSNTKL